MSLPGPPPQPPSGGSKPTWPQSPGLAMSATLSHLAWVLARLARGQDGLRASPSQPCRCPPTRPPEGLRSKALGSEAPRPVMANL